MKLGVIGSDGYFAKNISKCFKERWKNVEVLPYSRSFIDIRKFNDVTYLRNSLFDCLINCAGATKQDEIELYDEEYIKAIETNVFGDFFLKSTWSGYYVHLSSPFALFPELSRYCKTKYVSLMYHANQPNSLTIIPGYPYGGIGSKQFDNLLYNNMSRKMVIDNTVLFNPINITDLSEKVCGLIMSGATGVYFICDKLVCNKYDFATAIYPENDNWTAGRYVNDLAKRPEKWDLDTLKQASDFFGINYRVVQTDKGVYL